MFKNIGITNKKFYPNPIQQTSIPFLKTERRIPSHHLYGSSDGSLILKIEKFAFFPGSIVPIL
jgi:hypothetical protein